jgi:LPS sulfotransferase NodH
MTAGRKEGNDATMQQFEILPGEFTKIRRDMSPANDFPHTRCRLKYLICSTPRSGSWLLSTGLASTGAAGRPAEYFSPLYVKAYLERIGSTGDFSRRSAYMRFLQDHRTSPNGVFGMKMHFGHLARVFERDERQRAFLRKFDRLIYLTRRDKLAQAVSFWKAFATSVYRAEAGDSTEAPPQQASYSFPGIAERLRAIAEQERDWSARLSAFPEKTYALYYEDLAADYVGAVEQVLTALGLPDAISALDPRPEPIAQRDETSRRWEQRFLQDLRSGESHFGPTASGV